MFISCNWLRRHVDLDGQDLDDLANRFTLSVAELEGVHHVGAGLDTVVVGHVMEVHAIEGARIQRTLVDCGEGSPRQIVCGAPNIAANQDVLVALPGTTLGEMTIKEATIRGIASAGMICSETELNLGSDGDGIMVLDGTPSPGTTLSALCGIEDTLLEIDNKSLTHRPDLWGHRGLAREVAALLGKDLKPMETSVDYTSDTPLQIRVDDPKACPRYTAMTLDGITIKPSPLWLRVLLHRVGTRPINNVVDATNFVMLDLGNPLHAFDRRQIAGNTIVVRSAKGGEAFTTLDGVERSLTAKDLLISDSERGVALAGIMGGENSEIQTDTQSVLLEAANFDAAVVRMTSQRLGLRTESSARFEKSLDPYLASDAAEAFCTLLQSLDSNVRVTSALMDVAASIPAPDPIDLRLDVVEKRLGTTLGMDLVETILSRLEFGCTRMGDTLRVEIPSFRATKDIAIEMDLVEEIGRFYGYDNIEPVHPAVALSRPHPNKQKQFERKVRHFLSGPGGFDEAMTYSFDFDPLLKKIGALKTQRVTLRNPISAEMPALRTSLAPNLLGLLERNDRLANDLRFYEVGRRFEKREGSLPHQPVMLGAIVAETKEREGAHLFFTLKGILDSLSIACERKGMTLTQGGVDHPWVHPVRCARVFAGSTEIGYVAEVHPQTLKQLGVGFKAAICELDLDLWRSETSAGASYTPLPKFPSVFRDFAVIVPEDIRAEEVRQALYAANPELVADVTFQSVYRGNGVEPGFKSLAWSLTMRHIERTLNEDEIRSVEEAVWTSLTDRVGGVPRA
jgi:phenylalanyl-tRNA synthetase beta chain